MKWNKKRYNQGDKRIKTCFAWFPRFVYHPDHVEIRWLERVTILQERWESWDDSGWGNIKFIDEKPLHAQLDDILIDYLKEKENEEATGVALDNNGNLHHRV